MDQSPYQIIGEEAGVQKLVNKFYDEMDSNPKMKLIRDLHSKNLDTARKKLFEFLTGWLGGPDLYIQKYGHPKMRARHLPFPIGKQERDQWLVCMRLAMDSLSLPEEWDRQIFMSFYRFASHMMNKTEEEQPNG